MERLLQTFETPFRDTDGDTYDVQVYGRSRPGDTWEGWLVFTRQRDGVRYITQTETTQPSSEAVLYWATGLSTTYFDGAFVRARGPAPIVSISGPVPPLRDVTADERTYLRRLNELEQRVLTLFRHAGATRLATQGIFNVLPNAHADVVRALEHLEKERRFLVRRTEGGNDWLILTQDGVRAAGIRDATEATLAQ